MIRCWWVAVLLFSLWPITAAVGTDAPAGWHASPGGTFGEPSDPLLPTLEFQVEQAPVVRRAGCGIEPPLPDLPLPAHAEVAFFSHRPPVGPTAPVDPLAPLCERLPYDATAPPHVR